MALLRSFYRKFSPVYTWVPCRFKGYIVLLPEIPDDTLESNSLLEPTELPKFKELSPEKCYSALGKLCLDYETGVWDLEEKLKDADYSKSFDSVVNTLDKLDASLSTVWGAVKTLNVVKNNEVTSDSYLRIHERARRARIHTFHSLPIYEACRELYTKDENLSNIEKRILKKFLLEARLNGIEIPKNKIKTHISYLNKMEEEKDIYRKKLHESTRRFAHRIDDAEVVRDFPENLLKSMSLNSVNYLQGPWKVTLQPHVYQGFLEHCPDKDLRYNAWKAYTMRCTANVDRSLDNSKHVEEIRQSRHMQANMLGFDHYAQMSMETKMAGTVDNVLSMITSLIAKAKPAMLAEMSSLNDFAESRGFNGTLESCDVDYWSRKQKQHLFNISGMRLEKYFSFDYVWDELLHLSSNLFGISVCECTDANIQKWHHDVKYYKIMSKSGEEISTFYLDPYERPGEKLPSSYMLPMRNKTKTTKPVVSLIFNFKKQESGEGAALNLNEVETLFQKYGNCLQHLLSSVPYSEASGLRNIEWDAVEMSSNFMVCWLYEPSVLQKISKHSESGAPLSPVMIKDIISSRTHMSGYKLCNELYLSHLDMRLHTEEAFWVDIAKELHEQYHYFPLERKPSICCSFSPIISDAWAAGYYSHIWARMLAEDAFAAFKECDQSEVSDEGMRFVSTFLNMGGGCHASEVFRKFRGRDPSPQALLSKLEL